MSGIGPGEIANPMYFREILVGQSAAEICDDTTDNDCADKKDCGRDPAC